MLQTKTDRQCHQCEETVENIISACPITGKERYIKGHDIVCAQLHFNICNEIGVKLDNKHWFDHVPKSVERCHEGKVAILWNQQLRTSRYSYQ